MMRGICTICTDFFSKDQDISATNCGHVFHETCLSRWLKQCGTHWTCPQCRSKQTQKQIVRKLYFDIPESEVNEIDPYLLKNQLSEIQVKKEKLKADKKKLKEMVQQCQEKNENLISVKKTLQKDLKEAKHTSEFLKDQLKIMKEGEKEAIEAQNEAKRLREKLKTCEKMEFILEGQKNQVDEMVSQYTSGGSVPSSVRQLATFCAALKQEYENVKSSRNRAKEEIMKTKREIHKLNQQLHEKTTTCEKLEESVGALQKNEEQLMDENQSLRKRLEALQTAISSPSDTRASAISRLLLESPAPLLMTPDGHSKITDLTRNKRLSSESYGCGIVRHTKKPKLSPSAGCHGVIDLDAEVHSSNDGSFICEPKSSEAENNRIAAMRDKTNTESPGTVQTKKVCEEMGLKFVKTTSSIKNSLSKPRNLEENIFRKPTGFPSKQTNVASKRRSQANKYFLSGRTNKVPLSSKAKPFSSKPLPATSMRPKLNLVKKSGAW